MVLPLLGAVLGGFAGTFLGAFAAELSSGQSREAAMRLGYGAFIARIFAVAAKIGVSLAMACLGFFWLL